MRFIKSMIPSCHIIIYIHTVISCRIVAHSAGTGRQHRLANQL